MVVNFQNFSCFLLSLQEINSATRNFSSACNTDPECLSSLIVLMSYGNSTSIYGSDMKIVKLRKLMKRMQCQGLKAKPKLVFYQASQLRMFLFFSSNFCFSHKLLKNLHVDHENLNKKWQNIKSYR